MTPIKVLVVEDLSLIAESLKLLLTKYGMNVVGVCASGEEAIEAVGNLQPDLILMDIDLAGAIDGISAAQVITKERSLPIIYLTDFTDDKTVQRAKLTHPASYVTKPFNEGDLIRAIDIAFHNANHEPASSSGRPRLTFIRDDAQRYVKVDLDRIFLIKADRAYCKIIMEEGEKVMTTNMNHVFEQIASDNFIRVHRSFVVNLDKVTAIEGNVIKLGPHEAQMSGEYREAFMKKIKILR
jgi:DNA-binding LytR/AlgR family response regulator